MVNIGFQERLAKAAAAVGRGALPVLASGLQSRIYSLPSICLLQSCLEPLVALVEHCPMDTPSIRTSPSSSTTYLRMRSERGTKADSQDSTF